MRFNRKTIIKATIILFVILLLFWFNRTYLQLSPAMIREWILDFGLLAPFIYIVVYTLRPMILFPASILSIAGGLAFGALWGTVYTVIGATLGAVLSFIVARKLGKNLVNKEWTGHFYKIQRQMEDNGFLYVVSLRFIPLFNFDMISYAAGISKVRPRAFFLGTLLGIIPGTFAYNFLGSSFADGGIQTVLIAVAIFALILLVPLFFRKKFQQKYNIPDSK